MSIAEPGGVAGLVDRVRNLLLHPKTEWERIKGEQTSLQSLLTGYALPLLALGALCSFIGAAFVGIPIPLGDAWRMPIQFALGSAIVSVVLALVMVWVVGLIINSVAPSFGSQQDQMQANKVAAYSPTATWIASFVAILPILGPLLVLVVLAGWVYSAYLLWIGLPKLMNTPEDKKVGFFITILVIILLAGLVLGLVASAVQRIAMPGAMPPMPM
jgi:hypothetical protein